MRRRNLLQLALALTPASLLATRAQAAPATPDAAKVAYHLSDLDKVDFVLGNIANHYSGMGGPENVTIALVIHGPALKAFHTANASRDLAKRVSEFVKSGLAAEACVHTMKSQNVTL